MAEPKTAIGIHLAGKVLHRAELIRDGARLRLVHLETIPLSLESAAPVGKTLAQPARSGEETRVLAALPSLDAMTRCWTLPDNERERMQQILANRLEAESPVPIEELTWSYRLGDGLNGSGTRPVLVQAARNLRIHQWTTKLSASGCSPDVLTTEAEALGALARHALNAGATKSELLVFAGEAEWMLCVLSGGLVRCVRRIRPDAAASDLLCRQVGQMVESELGPVKLERIRWCGVLSLQAEALAERLHVTVERVVPGIDLLKPDGSSLPPEELAVFGPAIGLAIAGLFDDRGLIGLGVKQREEDARGRFAWLTHHPWRWTAAAVFLGILAIILHVQLLRHETRLMQAANEHAVDPFADLDPKVRSMQRLERYRIDVEGIAAELSRTIPPSVVTTSVQVARDRRLVIKGTSGDPKAIYNWVEALRKSQRFATVNPERSAPGQGGDFTISAEINGVQKLTVANVVRHR